MNARLPEELRAIEDGSDELLERARAGDVRAFEALYRIHHRRVYALCRRLVADGGLAEELTQDTFVKAWRALGEFRGDARLATWLRRIAVNTVVSYQRRHGPWLDWLRRRTDPPEAGDARDGAAARDLERAIARLPPRARQVFVLMDVEGHSHEEAAALLGMAIGTSKAQLHRARQLLRGFLQ
jgi:RNA polymerase sigma-70 factor (ECF subfamily)